MNSLKRFYFHFVVDQKCADVINGWSPIIARKNNIVKYLLWAFQQPLSSVVQCVRILTRARRFPPACTGMKRAQIANYSWRNWRGNAWWPYKIELVKHWVAIFFSNINLYHYLSKGQLFSKCRLVSSNLPKKHWNIFQDFCPSLEVK